MTEANRQLLTTGQVARRLGWAPNTIRAHLCSFEEWERRGRYESEQIPSIKIGGRAFVFRWWLDAIVSLAKAPPDATGGQ